jgi:hypothetical protein
LSTGATRCEGEGIKALVSKVSVPGAPLLPVSAHVCSLFAVEGDASPLPEHRSAERLMLREQKALRPETLMVSLPALLPKSANIELIQIVP